MQQKFCPELRILLIIFRRKLSKASHPVQMSEIEKFEGKETEIYSFNEEFFYMIHMTINYSLIIKNLETGILVICR